MIRIGAEVKPGDILIGKITQRRIRSYSRREIASCNLRDKAGDVKDASLKALFFTWCSFDKKRSQER
jgi:DNA-directed RNA polymerase beta subunit